ncbi:MAG: ATP-binding cassette domain-containing protein [Bacteriovoracaceae bacterium]|nr:ATP-binding cassette domain-containing protein [Bacteriovoracaceae bacterium]
MFLSWMAVVSSQGYAAWKRVKSLYCLLEVPLEDEKLWSQQFSNKNEELQFRLPYWDRELDLKFKLNSWSVICGETGSGKSELLKKMSQRLAVGRVSFSMVQQEPYLFNDTIESNIFLGKVISEEKRLKAIEYLQLFGLDLLTTSSKSLLSLEVGENGKRLSGGQAKRLALVRSLMADTDVLLWDDPFSSVDVLLEKKILQALRTKEPSKTFILTSHRLTTVRSCDEACLIHSKTGLTKDEGALVDFFSEQVLETATS